MLEIFQLHRLHEWEPDFYSSLPKKPVKYRCIYAIKPDISGEGIRFEARHVTKGFTPEYGTDYFDTYSQVADNNLAPLLIVFAHQRDD